MALTACEGTSSRPESGTGTSEHSARIDSGNPESLTIPPPLTIQPMVSPDTTGQSSAEGGAAPLPGAMATAGVGTLPVAAPLGLRADQLFSEHLKNPEDRIARLETAVTDIRRDLDTAMPSINRLVAIEGDIQELVRQLQTLTTEGSGAEGGPAAIPSQNIPPISGQSVSMPMDDDAGISNTATSASVPASPAPLSPPPPPPPTRAATIAPLVVAPQPPLPVTHSVSTINAEKAPLVTEADLSSVRKPAAQPSATSTPSSQKSPPSTSVPPSVAVATRQIKLSGIRVGDHGSQIRIVIDSAKPITVSDDFDSVEKILILDIDGADVETAQGARGNNNYHFVSSISLHGTGPGLGQAVFELTTGKKVQKISSLPPSKDNPNYRTVIDIEK